MSMLTDFPTVDDLPEPYKAYYKNYKMRVLMYTRDVREGKTDSEHLPFIEKDAETFCKALGHKGYFAGDCRNWLTVQTEAGR